MQPFTKLTGIVAPLDRVNVDTDQIVPKQFIKWLTRDGYGRVLFYDWRYQADGKTSNPEFILNAPRYQGASILVARANFGCGSSREHAPWAILDYGFRVVIAPSFADIFYNNCTKNGILPVVLPDEKIDEIFCRVEEREGYQLGVDLESKSVQDDSGLYYSFDIDPFRRECLLNGWDDIGLTLRVEDKITQYEKARHPSATQFSTTNVAGSKGSL
jgi:3-isopropylmalate/(R)-2-methylmalate dehydratase small subunit